METIKQGTSESTALDRIILWEIAWEQFKDNPILGVGPHNFGVRAPEYTTKNTMIRYPNIRTLWGRSLHNIYFQTLCEQGIVGVILFIVIIKNFFSKNKKIRQMLIEIRKAIPFQKDKNQLNNSEINQYIWFSYSLFFANIGYLIGGFFYPIYEYEWFWHQLILNMLFFIVISDKRTLLDQKSDTTAL
jgi:O-antigen ligase